MTAFSTIGTKTGKGRNTRAKARVPDVETLPCGDTTHRIVWRGKAMVCAGCGISWADLDAAAREAL